MFVRGEEGRGWAELHSWSPQSISSLRFIPVESVTFLRASIHCKKQASNLMFDTPRTVMRLLRGNDTSQWHGKGCASIFPCMVTESKELTWEHLFTGTRDFVACNHLRSYKYYSDSIMHPDGFLGYACASYDVFETVSISQSLRMDHTKNSSSYLYIWNSIYFC